MATRFYLPSSGTPEITPTKDAIWDFEAAGYTTYPTSTAKSSSAMATVSFDDADPNFADCIMRQYVSAPIAAQTIVAQTITCVIRGLQSSTLNNMHLEFGVRVLSNDGSVVRGTMIPANTFEAAEFTASLVSRKASATSTQVIALAGDRIVIEIGAQGNPSTQHDYSLRIGDVAANDLDDGTGETDDDNPWVNFATDTIVFERTITPSPVTIPIVVPAPGITFGITLTPSPIAIPISIPAPTVNLALQTITPSPVAIPIVIPAPTVQVITVQAYQGLTRLLNPTDWGGSPTLILEVHGFTSSAGSPFKAHLFNITDGGVVSGSQISSANTVLDRLRSSAFSLVAGSKEYEVRYGGVSGATYTMEDAVLIVSP